MGKQEFLFLVLVCIAAGSACRDDLDNIVISCGGVLGLKYSRGESITACPDYFRTRDCVTFYLSRCNASVQARWNSTLSKIYNYFQSICQYYIPPASGMPTLPPDCNLTTIYLEVVTCIGNLWDDAKAVRTLSQKSTFCSNYRRAWACALRWIDPCPWAPDYFKDTMHSIRTTVEPHCGNPNGSHVWRGTQGMLFTMAYVVLTLFLTPN